MKKLFAILAFGALVGSANAQKKSKSDGGMMIGAKAGVNFGSAKLKEPVFPDLSGTFGGFTGFAIGGFGNFSMGGKFSIQPELFYGTEGFNDKTYKATMGFINVPVLAKYKFAEGFSAIAGPQLGFLLSSTRDGIDAKEFTNSTNFSGVIGAEYMLESGLGFNARYQMGLSNLSKLYTGSEFKSNVISIGLVYAIKK